MSFDALHSKWFLPGFSVVMGLVMLAAASYGGRTGDGIAMLVVMTVVGAAILLGGRSETIRGLRGDGRDERMALIDLRATAYSGLVLIIVIIGMFIYEIAQGHSGAPYMLLGAVSGISYIAFVVLLRLRG